jgi:hypothetical protein
MRCIKTVTPRKIEANRANATHSTGPRSERGKRVSKFNAVTLGLFARHVAIPICDGTKAETDFGSLLEGLHDEFQPFGFYEEWLVVKIAESMWSFAVPRDVKADQSESRPSGRPSRQPSAHSRVGKRALCTGGRGEAAPRVWNAFAKSLRDDRAARGEAEPHSISAG